MSSQPMSSERASFGDLLFKRFTAIYGTQKVGGMWAGADRREVQDLWTGRLARYKPETIALALDALIDSGKEWPPNLPEFDELCRRTAEVRVGRRLVLPAPRRPKPADYRFPDLSAERSIDGLRWLRRVGSMSVARALLSQAEKDWRVAKILEHHIERDFADVVNPESRSFLRAWSAANPGWKASAMNPEDRAA